MRIDVVGGGAWGTALAVNACAGGAQSVALWVRDAAQLEAMHSSRLNRRYLPGVTLPPSLDLRPWPANGPAQPPGDLVIVATPVAALRGVLAQLRGCPAPVAWLCKGFEQVSDSATEPVPFGLLPHEIWQQVAPELSTGVLSGPSFAQEVANRQPTALVAASSNPQVSALLVQALHGPSLRIYASDDVTGVEVGGAVKNVLAIATGLADGLRLGLNARAALVTRGLSEMTRLGVALGARAETFMGLSGLGDLVLTATGDLSRNRKVGLALAAGQSLDQVVQSLGHVAEGVYCARTVVQRAKVLGVEMPIAEVVVALLDGRTTPTEAIVTLMGREARPEV